ncbi:hypothetical protein FIE12Z_5119 [Fusarium flagelliforme]|uniref:Uncharacterized protein n=1 Tax=Fusarium flagelliforme TaxID=2675880 RepID=A0A395MSQ7_9HYPO|nr:hypothetical protein FIE12Z_5119 [Fusarium flagelliforme]
MHYLVRFLLVLNLWSIQGVYGRALSEPTQSSHLADYGRPLRTTHLVEFHDFRNMAKRDSPESVPITIAPDKTCGFISGSPYNPVTCMNPAHQCAWEDNQIKAVMCGAVLDKNDENWVVNLNCFERDEALDTQLCGDTCKGNQINLLCTNRSAPYCKTYAYPKGVRDYICAPTRALQSVSFTVDTERAAQFITATVPLTVGQATETETSYTFIETDTEPVTTSISEASKTIPPPPSPSSKPDSNLGAIIGGAVGGFAALLLIVLAIFWFVRRLKSDDTPGKGGSIKTHEMSGEPTHFEISGEPVHYEMSGEPTHFEMSGEPATSQA